MYISRQFRTCRHRGPLESHAHENRGLRARAYSRRRRGITLGAQAEPIERELCLDGALSAPGDTGPKPVRQVPSTVQLPQGLAMALWKDTNIGTVPASTTPGVAP